MSKKNWISFMISINRWIWRSWAMLRHVLIFDLVTTCWLIKKCLFQLTEISLAGLCDVKKSRFLPSVFVRFVQKYLQISRLPWKIHSKFDNVLFLSSNGLMKISNAYGILKGLDFSKIFVHFSKNSSNWFTKKLFF